MRRIATSLILALVAFMLAAPPAAEAASVQYSFSGGVLTATGTSGDDSLDAGCSGFGNVTVNSVTNFGLGPILCASVAAITLLGKDGNDSLNTTPVNGTDYTSILTTTLKGGAGNDTLSASVIADTVKGGAGNDSLRGSFGNDNIGGGKGYDTLVEIGFPFGMGDTIMLTDTTMSGDLGNDTLSSMESADIKGTTMADVMSAAGFHGRVMFDGDAAGDSITGGPGDDTLLGGPGADTIVGGSGNDGIVPGPSDDTVQGGPGNDTLAESTAASTTVTDTTMTASTTGTDHFTQMERVFVIADVAAPVTLNAGAASIPVMLMSGTGNDTLIGGSGDDAFMTSLGTDSVNGGAGSDVLINVADAHQSLTNTTLTASGETDALLSIERAILEGGPSDNAIFTSSFGGRVVLRGEGGNDALIGGNRDDELFGGDGDDTLDGMGGDDLLDGGHGNDTCNGGSGSNTLKSC